MTQSVGLRFRVRQGTMNEPDDVGMAPVGEFEPSVAGREVAFRFKLREGWRR